MKKNLIKIIFGLCCYALFPIYGNSQNFSDATNDASIVPVQLLYFKAELQSNNVLVNWATVTETNNSYFNVLRSLNGKDFSSIGKVNGKGNTSNINNYSLLDASFPKQNLYYQLEQIDLDGKKTLSAIVLIKMGPNFQVDVSIFPNPVKNKKLSLIMNNIIEDNYSVSIINADGKFVYNQQRKFSNNIPIAIQLPEQLQAGLYVVKVQDKTSTLNIVRQLLIY